MLHVNIFSSRELIISNVMLIIHRSQFIAAEIEVEVMFYDMCIKTLFETRS